MPRHRWGVWALVLAVLACWLVGLVLGDRPVDVASKADDAPALAAVGGAPVVVVGVPGLTWDLVDPERTPTLDRLAREGASAALVVRGTHEVTCPADAWLTLGAGQRAATDLGGCGDAPGPGSGDALDGTPPREVSDVLGSDGVAPVVWHRWQEAAERRALGPQLGTLARLTKEVGTCVAAYGADAALAAADPDGTVAHLAPDGIGAQEVPDLQTGCQVHLVSGPVILDGDRGARLAGVDAAVGELMEDLPAGSRVVVMGAGHTTARAEATVLVSGLVGAPAEPRNLTSASTRQVGLVQLTDLTVGLVETAVATAGETAGETAGRGDDPLAGGRVVTVEDSGASGPSAAADTRARAADLAAGVSEAKRLAPWALGLLAAIVLPILGLTVALRLHRATATPTTTPATPTITPATSAINPTTPATPATLGTTPTAAAVVATLAMAVPAATFLAGLLPWWRSGQPVVALAGAVLLTAALVTAAAWAGPWRRDLLGPPAVVAGVTLGVLGLDVLDASSLGLVSVLGLQPVTAGRFYGQGNVGFGIMLGAFLVLAAVAVSRLPRVEAAAAVLLLGGATTLVNAAPQAGADFGGVPGTVLASGLLALSALGLRWRARSLALLALSGLVVAGAVMLADWSGGPDRRTHLGDFVQSALDGEAAGVVTRKLSQSLGILVSYPLSWLAVLALVLVTAVALTRRPPWTAALWREPGVRPALLAGAVAMGVTWALNDSGIAAVALTLALLIAFAIIVLAALPGDRPARGARPSAGCEDDAGSSLRDDAARDDAAPTGPAS